MRVSTIFAFIVSLIIQVGFPLAVVLLYRRRTRARWHLYAYGAIVFAVFQLFTWLPLAAYLEIVIGSHLQSKFQSFIWLLALAMMTSLVEETGRWWGYRCLFPRENLKLTWRNSIMYGLGHGSMETILLIAGVTFVNLIAYLLLSRFDLNLLIQSMGNDASPALQEALQSIVKTTWTQPLVVALERILALPHQVAWSVLVMESLAFRQKRWFGFAVLYHASIAVIVPGLAHLLDIGAAEGVNIILALLSLWIILRLRAVSPTEE